MASQEQLRAMFNGMNTAQKGNFINNLKKSLVGSDNIENIRFLDECTAQYNNEVEAAAKPKEPVITQPPDNASQIIPQEIEPEPDFGSESKTEPELDFGREPEYGTGLESGPEPEYGIGLDLKREPEYGTGLESGHEPEYGIGLDLEREPEYGTGLESEPVTGSVSEFQTASTDDDGILDPVRENTTAPSAAKNTVTHIEAGISELYDNIRYNMSVIDTITDLLSGTGSEIEEMAQAQDMESYLSPENAGSYENKIGYIEERFTELADSVRRDMSMIVAISDLLSGKANISEETAAYTKEPGPAMSVESANAFDSQKKNEPVNPPQAIYEPVSPPQAIYEPVNPPQDINTIAANDRESSAEDTVQDAPLPSGKDPPQTTPVLPVTGDIAEPENPGDPESSGSIMPPQPEDEEHIEALEPESNIDNAAELVPELVEDAMQEGRIDNNQLQRSGENNDPSNLASSALKGGLNTITSKINKLAGESGSVDLKLRDLFSNVPKKHTRAESDEIFIAGTVHTTPDESEIVVSWPKPWLFSRVLLVLLITFALLYICSTNFNNPLMLPGMMFIGALAIPFSVLIFIFETNAPRNISIFEVIKMFFVGGMISLVSSLVLFEIFPLVEMNYIGALTVAFIEEVGKLLAIVIFVRILNPRYILNGLLIGAAIGAGFAVFETAGYAFKYFIASSSRIDVLIDILVQRAWSSIGAHVVWAAITGAALVLVKGDDPFRAGIITSPRFLRFLALPIVMHATWNSPLLTGSMAAFYLKLVVLIVAAWIVILVLLNAGLKQIKRICANADDQSRKRLLS